MEDSGPVTEIWKSFGTFCRLGSDKLILPVAEKYCTSVKILYMCSVCRNTFSFCRANTTLVREPVIRRHSSRIPGRGCRGRNFSRTSLEVENWVFWRPRPPVAPRRLGRVGWPRDWGSPFTGNCSSINRT